MRLHSATLLKLPSFRAVNTLRNSFLRLTLGYQFRSKNGIRTHRQDPFFTHKLLLFSRLVSTQLIVPLHLLYAPLLNLRERTPLCCRNLAYSFQLHYPGVTDTYIYFVCYGCNVWVKTFLSQGNNTFVFSSIKF